MSNNRFTVDAVPTPTLNLAKAFEEDLQYYVRNGNKMPPPGRSALRRAEEELNTYLKFLNESFILKGFTKGSTLTVQVINAGTIQSKDGSFVIDLDNATWTMADKDGNVVYSYSPETGLMLSGKLYAEEGTIGGFTIGENSMTAGSSTSNQLQFVTNASNPYVKLGNLMIRYKDSVPTVEATSGVLKLGAADKISFLVDEEVFVQFYRDELGWDTTKYVGISGVVNIDGKLTVNGSEITGSGGSGMSQIGEGYTTGSNVNMRAYPSTSAPATHQISYSGSDIIVYGRGMVGGETWFYCRYDEDYIGWIHEDFVYVVMG